MPQSREPHSVGAHRLGPHVVGQRVVVRHLLPDGRATDVLGVCTAWGEDVVTIESDRGPVSVATDTIVTGKPVPPRASVRARVSAQDAERRLAALWPTMTTIPVGAWLVRASPPHDGRLRRRGNSALAMVEPGIGLLDAAWRVRELYSAMEQTPVIQVQLGSPLEESLAPLGFAPMGDGDAHCQLASTSRTLRSLRASAPDVAASLDEVPGRLAVSVEGGMARGRAVVSEDWLLVEGLSVDPAQRRQGLATAVLAELLDWGASLGARTAMLHVEVANPEALGLYENHGFVTHHTTRYLVG